MKKKKLIIILIVFALVLGVVVLSDKKGTEEINSDYRVATKKI